MGQGSVFYCVCHSVPRRGCGIEGVKHKGSVWEGGGLPTLPTPMPATDALNRQAVRILLECIIVLKAQIIVATFIALKLFQIRIYFSYLDDTLSHLLNCLKRERERPAAFQAIGLIAVSVQADINRDLPRIMDVIRASLPSKELPQK